MVQLLQQIYKSTNLDSAPSRIANQLEYISQHLRRKMMLVIITDENEINTLKNNNSNVFFFDVYRSGSNELLYTYEVRANSTDGNTVATFSSLSEQFYKNWQRSVDAQNKGK